MPSAIVWSAEYPYGAIQVSGVMRLRPARSGGRSLVRRCQLWPPSSLSSMRMKPGSDVSRGPSAIRSADQTTGLM